MTDTGTGAAVPLREQLEAMAHATLIDFAEVHFDRGTSYLAQIDQLKDRIDSLEEANGQHKSDLQTTRQLLANEQKRSREILDENNNFREQLHDLEVELARMQGYQRRVQEFDPVAEKQEYADRHRPVVMHHQDLHSDGMAMTPIRRGWWRRG